MIDEQTWKEVVDRLEKAERVVITTHVNPDGDAIGSEVAVSEILAQKGKQVHIFNHSPTPKLYDFLNGRGWIEHFDASRHEPLLEEADLAIILDISDWARLGTVGKALQKSDIYRICIDHHIVTDGVAQLMVVDRQASCTGEIVFDLAKRVGADISGRLAEALYTCVLTDTGSFRFTNTTPKAHRMAAELIERGVPFLEIYERVYEQNSPGRICLLAEAIRDLHFENGGKIAWFRVTQKMLKRCNASYWETENLPEMPRSIQGVEVTIMFAETAEGFVKVSLRSKGRVSVHDLANKFGGGGHPYAAGARLKGSLDEVVPVILNEAKALFR